MISRFLIILAAGLVSGIVAVEEVKDGNLYQITSALDNLVLTVTNGDMEAGSNISVQAWQDQSTQKWLAVLTSKQGGADNFLMVPKRQKWDWSKFVARGGGSLKNRYDDLIGSTLVLGVMSHGKDKEVEQQTKNDKPSQVWQFNPIGSTGKILVRNVESDLCLENPGEKAKKGGIFHKIQSAAKGAANQAGVRHPKSKLILVKMAGCDRGDEKQQWIVESHLA